MGASPVNFSLPEGSDSPESVLGKNFLGRKGEFPSHGQSKLVVEVLLRLSDGQETVIKALIDTGAEVTLFAKRVGTP